MKLYKKLAGFVGVVGFVGLTLANSAAQANHPTPQPNPNREYYTGESAPLYPQAFYDINVTSPQTMRDFLWVIDSTYDLLLSQGASSRRISFVVSLRGLSVAFATQDFGVGDPQNEQTGIEIRQYLETLAAKGVRIEACQISLDWVHVNANSLLDCVAVIDNAFAASIWYQTRGYALVPIHQLPS